MNTEQQERLKQIRERHNKYKYAYEVETPLYASEDIDFLLSLLDSDSQAAAVMVSDAPARLWVELRTQHAFTVKPDPYMETVEYGTIDSFNQHYENLMRAGLLREQDAATRMRDECVAKLKERLHDPSLRFSDDGIKAAVTDWTNMLINILSSLTLDQEQEKQR